MNCRIVGLEDRLDLTSFLGVILILVEQIIAISINGAERLAHDST
jgi:hypothetical protein